MCGHSIPNTSRAVYCVIDLSDVFEKVVPLAVHQALTSFEGRKGEVVNMQVGRLREATQLMNR